MKKLMINVAVAIAAVAGLAAAPGSPPASTGGGTHPVGHHPAHAVVQAAAVSSAGPTSPH
jgi:hypothetical protein